MALCLIVDDDMTAARAAAHIAGSMGLQVQIESNGLTALAFCQQVMPELILLDVRMPKLDGIGFLKQLHKMMGGRNPYVIACTGFADVATVTSLKAEAVKGYVIKPYSVELLQAKIRESGVL